VFGCWHSLWFVFSAALTHYLSLRNTLTDDQNRPIKPFYFHDGTRFKCGSTDQNPCAHSSRCLRKRRTLRNNSVGRS
jgi:hypothetical protein